MVLRSECPDRCAFSLLHCVHCETLIPPRTMLRVYLIHPSESYPPRLELVWTVGVQKIENFTALGSYIVYGWIDRSHTEPRHLIKVLKFESCHPKLAEYSTMKVKGEISKYSVSTTIVDNIGY